MSQEDVELVRQLQPPSGPELTAVLRDEAVWAELRDAIEPLVEPDCPFVWVAWGQRLEYRGLDGFREGWLDWFAPWESYRSETQDILDVGDRVVVLVRHRGRHHDGDTEVEMRAGGVFFVENGKLARAELYASRAEALEAAGLSEKDAHGDAS